ncbi:hypothetical protein B0I37DRAFT_445473 [Chaetomium sp. MPI-CAGE-AT-0009]|nr:hypothetical protein B0I37DRAFT_445473 [Chaetomium sp. MPI-CAGE-AT-0009]
METVTFADLFKACGAASYTDNPIYPPPSPFHQPLVLDNEGDLWIEVGGGDEDADSDGNTEEEDSDSDGNNEEAESYGYDDEGPSWSPLDGNMKYWGDEQFWHDEQYWRDQTAYCKKVYRFRVCSRAMRRASPVWKAMLFGPWREREPDDGQDWVVRLPHDQPVAMAVLFAIAHGRLELVPQWRNNDLGAYAPISAILSAADKYDMLQPLLPFVHIWEYHSHPPDSSGSGDGGDYDYLVLLKRLNIWWQLGMVKEVEKNVRQLIYSITRDRLDGLLAAADNGPSIGLSLSLREVLGKITNLRQTAIQSTLDFFNKLVEDVSCKDPKERCIKAMFGASYEEAVEWEEIMCLSESAVVPALYERYAQERRDCNASMLSQIWGRLRDNGQPMPKEAKDIYTSVDDLLDLVGRTLPSLEVFLPGHKSCNQRIHTQFQAFRSELAYRYNYLYAFFSRLWVRKYGSRFSNAYCILPRAMAL